MEMRSVLLSNITFRNEVGGGGKFFIKLKWNKKYT